MRLNVKFLIAALVGLSLLSHDSRHAGALAQDVEKSAAETAVASGENYVVYAWRKTELQDHLLGSSKKHPREDYTGQFAEYSFLLKNDD